MGPLGESLRASPPTVAASASAIAASILADAERVALPELPHGDEVVAVLRQLLPLLFPRLASLDQSDAAAVERFVGAALAYVRPRLVHQLTAAYSCAPTSDARPAAESAASAADALLAAIPSIRETLAIDARAAFDGDPAARSVDEVIVCYPGLLALAVHRVSHTMHRDGVPLVPRMMSEWAHRETGIDIHPGAVIGKGFFIDHGTGVVIGETAEIGEFCRIYQGVTLGAKSFERDEAGRIRRGYKRHPTLEDRVTVYAGATILGGDTVVGRGSVIAGGVFVMQSVPPNHVVAQARAELRVREQRGL